MALFENENKTDETTPENAEESTFDMGDAMGHYLDKDHLIGHVQDSTHFEVSNPLNYHEPMKLGIPNPMGLFGVSEEEPIIEIKDPALQQYLGPVSFQPTKFVVVELVAAILLAAVFVRYAGKVKNGQPVKGRFWNMIELVVLYIRDEIAVPAIGSKDSKQFLPFLWTIFFFILTLNLFGMLPYVGSATGSISVTIPLALSVFFIVLMAGTQKLGFVGFWKAQAPHMDLPIYLAVILIPGIWFIEVFGLFIKHMVLAVRLFANMFAGHMVLAVFIAFIGVGWGAMWSVMTFTPLVIGAATAISLLELMVAFIQAYVFTFLAALFIGAAVHPH